MKLLTAAEQRELDRLAGEHGLPVAVLMESAGAAVARAVLAHEPRSVIVYCGPGNNGGDGRVAARWLSGKTQVTCLDAAREHPDPRADVIVDAIFGTGLSRPPSGAYARAIDQINAAGARVISVDVPSGIDSDTGALFPSHVVAGETITFHAPKRGLYLHPAASVCGRIVVADIGIRGIDAGTCDLIDEGWAREQLAARPRNAHKNDFGHVLVVAGSRGKTGAAAMVCEAALRAGAGLVTLASDEVPALPPEVMTVPLGEAKSALKGKTALAIGPGLAQGAAFVAELIAALPGDCACVLDADALNALAQEREQIAERLAKAPIRPLLTPHPGEFVRLTGEETERVLADRIDAATRAAQRFGACLVLKGAHSVIADPEGTSAICAAGNAGMATAGSGDVLTGIAAAILARKGGSGGTGDRARLAVFLHAFAGDLAAAEVGETSLIATDIVRTGLPRLFRRWQR